MSDERILYLLHNLLKENKPAVVVPDTCFVKLDKNFTKLAAKSLAATFYADDNKRHNRLGYIQFIRNLCGVHSGHRSVNESNYKTYLDSIEVIGKEDGDDDLLLDKQSFLVEIVGYYKEQVERQKERWHQQELINSWDLKSLGDLYYTPSKQIENHAENKQLLLTLLEPPDENSSTKQKQVINKTVSKESTIELGYSIINLQQNDGIETIHTIISNLKHQEVLAPYEVEFIKYVFDSLETLRPELLKQFPFLIEQSLIELGTTLLDDYVDLDTYSTMGFIKKCISTDRLIYLQSLDICYELYAMSDYSSNLYDLVTYIHEIDVSK